MRSFELMTMSLLPLTQFENALPHSGARSIARERPGGARGLAWLAGGLRSSIVAAAATLLLGATGLQGGEDFAREVFVTRERPGDKAGRLRSRRRVYLECEIRTIM